MIRLTQSGAQIAWNAILCCIFIFSCGQPLTWSQVVDAESIHEFRERATGEGFKATLVELVGTKVKLRKEDDSIIEIKLTALTTEDQQWIRAAIKRREFLEKQARLIDKTAAELSQGNAKTQLAACVKLREFGVYASGKVDAVKAFIEAADNAPTKMEGLATLIVISQKDDESWKAALAPVREKTQEEVGFIYQAVPLYLTSLASFGEKSIPYLRYVAYTGKLEMTDDLVTKTVAAVAFDSLTGPKNFVRASAVAAMGKLDVSGANGSTLATQINDIILRCAAQAETKLNGQMDEGTIQAAIVAYGELTFAHTNMASFLTRHKQKYSLLVQVATKRIDTITKQRTELAKLAQAAKFRTFSDANGQNQIVAEFIRLEGETVRLRDASSQIIVLDLSSFSPDDQAWIKEKAGVK